MSTARKVNPKFRSWWRASKMTAAEIAAVVGRSRITVYAYRNGHTTPSLEVAQLIAQLSRGAVPEASWR